MSAKSTKDRPASTPQKRRKRSKDNAADETTLAQTASASSGTSAGDAPASRPKHTHLPVWPD